MKSQKTCNIKNGFSLIEVILVVAIVAFIASMGALFSTGAITRSYTISERDLLVALLTQTRAKALANVHESAHSLHIATSSYVLYEGTTFSESNPTNKLVPKMSEATLTGLSTVTFLPLTADVAGGGVISVIGGTQSYDVEVNSAGRINW
jgi:prepilin-type N-terminal cleavage/methylation domain-containing protein